MSWQLESVSQQREQDRGFESLASFAKQHRQPQHCAGCDLLQLIVRRFHNILPYVGNVFHWFTIANHNLRFHFSIVIIKSVATLQLSITHAAMLKDVANIETYPCVFRWLAPSYGQFFLWGRRRIIDVQCSRSRSDSRFRDRYEHSNWQSLR